MRDASLPEWIRPLVSSIRGIRESRQRAAKILEWIARQDVHDAAGFLELACFYSKDREHSLSKVHLDLVRHRHLIDRLGYEKLSAIYFYAAENELDLVKTLLRSDRFASSFDEPKPEGFARRLESLTLGERKQLSRRIPRHKMEFLLFDNDPLVIRDLLKNPKLIERDVLRITSRHQAPPKVLEEVLMSDRWMSRYAVRKSLVFNPHTPQSYVVGLLSHLRKEDLKLFLQSSSCKPEWAKMIRSFFLR